jgi:hypothetical protein
VADLPAQQKVTADRRLLDAAAIISVDSSSSDDAWGERTANGKRDAGENSDDAWGQWMATGNRDLSGGPEAV